MKYLITDEKGNKYICSGKKIYDVLNKIKTRDSNSAITLFTKEQILKEVDRILSSHKMYDKCVNEIEYDYMKQEWRRVYNSREEILFYTPAIEINCTSAAAKGTVRRLMEKEGYETELYGSYSVLVYKWDEKKIRQFTKFPA